MDILANINQAECKANCGFVAMRVFHYLENKTFQPILCDEFTAPAPLSTLTVYGKLDDIYLGKKTLKLELFEGEHDDLIFSCEQKLLEMKPNEHAIVSFSYQVSGEEKGHFFNIYRNKSTYKIIDAISAKAFDRYAICKNLSEYFHIKLPRVGADTLTKIQLIH
ncbi:hypothetical protein ACTL6P_19210 [Endozoicomonas acroporae]|uniref:hypothetical protein n=1 Tax=Endozoicomonas acroporae TaxID=1701104 RepID=UPI000C78617E|nr:hypothetical protein [Endozoicomonas acroporae]